MPAQLLRFSVLLLSLAFGASAFSQTTVTLRDGLNNYSGTQDTDASSSWPNAIRGDERLYSLNWSTGTAFIRFAIFESEGGPVPNGSTIISATLSVYQFEGPASTWEARRLLKNWQEMQATWNVAATGTSWETAGATGASDVEPFADGQASIGSIPGWLNINVTSGVQAFASGTANQGWRLGWVSGTTGAKTIHSSDTLVAPELRPTLTVTYQPSGSSGCEAGDLRPFEGNPVGGTAIVVGDDTAFEAEHFDCGGEGDAYHDTTVTTNPGQTFRANGESVDIIGTPDGLAVNEFAAEEWMVYTLNVTTGGTYDISFFAASNWSPSPYALRLEIDGIPVASQLSVAKTGGWNNYQWFTKNGVQLGAGTRKLKVISVTPYLRIDKIRLVRAVAPNVCNSAPLRPYAGDPVGGNRIQIPAGGKTFEAEHFNCGGPNVAYSELGSSNNEGQVFRAGEGVDITDTNDGLAINYFEAGEWFVHSIHVETQGTYKLGVFASASPGGGTNRAFRIELNGSDVTGTVPIAPTEHAQDFKWTTSPGVVLQPGDYELKLVSVGAYFRVDKITVTTAVTPPGEDPPGEEEPPSGGSEECGDGVDLCATFEEDKTSFTQTIMRTENSVPWFQSNDAGSLLPEAGRIGMVSLSAPDGDRALVFTTLNSDRCVQSGSSCNNLDPAQWERSEILLDPDRANNLDPTKRHLTTGGVENSDHWWAHSVYFPPEFQITKGDGRASVFLQFHNGGGPAISLEVYNQYSASGSARWKVFRVQAKGPGAIVDPYHENPGTPYEDGTQYHYIPVGHPEYKKGQCIHDNVEEGVWYHFIHRIKWSSAKAGIHQIWLRKGNTGAYKKIFDKTGISIIQSPPGRFRDYAYLKIGTYHDGIHYGVPGMPDWPGEHLRKDASGNYATSPGNGVSKVYHDRIRRGNSFQAVAPSGASRDDALLNCGSTQ